MTWFRLLRGRKQRPRKPLDLIVMRLADMRVVHPDQDNSRVCSKCGHQVGVYPSGQAVLRGAPDTVITCSVCAGPLSRSAVLAPGALEEPKQSVKAPPQPLLGYSDDSPKQPDHVRREDR